MAPEKMMNLFYVLQFTSSETWNVPIRGIYTQSTVHGGELEGKCDGEKRVAITLIVDF